MKTWSSLFSSFVAQLLAGAASLVLLLLALNAGRLIDSAICTFVMALVFAAAVLNRRGQKNILRVTDTLENMAAGDLDGRLTGSRDGGEVKRLALAFNAAADKVEAFTREVRGALEAASHSRFKRTIRPEGMLGDYKGNIEAINLACHRMAEGEQAVGAMIERIDKQVADTIESVSTMTSDLVCSADTMSGVTHSVGQDTGAASNAASEAYVSAQTVAAAAEELHASIAEIASQVSHSSATAQDAVAKTQHARSVVDRLGSAATEIGQVVKLIGDIASQTNLLALNATIEAARAGEAGKGFSVVANEVKNLANQTAKATEEITSRVGAIQQVADDVVSMIDDVSSSIQVMEAVGTGITAAVEEQAAATSEIARTINVTAGQAEEVKSRMSSVETSVHNAENAAHGVSSSAARMDESMANMRKLLIKAVRTSSDFANRRGSRRHAVMLDVELRAEGQVDQVQIFDLSEEGAMAVASKKIQCERGMRFGFAIPSEKIEMQAEVVACTAGFSHFHFTSGVMKTADVERISAKSVSRMMEVAKNDHRAFVGNIAQAVEGKIKIAPAELSTHHTCRLGRWYDSVTDDRMMALPAFKELYDRHRPVHIKGRDILVAISEGKMDVARRQMSELEDLSAQVIAALDVLGKEFPSAAAA